MSKDKTHENIHFLELKTRTSYWDSNTAAGGELNENMNNGADTGDDPLLIFFEENLKWLQRRTDELKTERAMQKNKFKYEFKPFLLHFLIFQVKKMVTGVGFGCTACTYSPDQYNEVEVIAAGTKLSRSFSNNMEVCEHIMRH